MKDNVKTTNCRWKANAWRRLFSLFLVLVSLIGLFPMEAFAAWDGSGDAGDGNGTTVTGGFKLTSTSTSIIVGYRFTVYDSAGVKSGHSIDVDFKSTGYTNYRVNGENKLSHIDLYRSYLRYDNGGLKNGIPVSLGTPTKGTGTSNYIYDDDTFQTSELPGITMASTQSDPKTMEQWLTEERGKKIAGECGASAYDSSNSYIIVEPLFHVFLNNDSYVLTMAELAVYQSAIVETARKNAFSSKAYVGYSGYVDSRSGMNVRSGPGTSYTKLGTVAAGSYITMTDERGTDDLRQTRKMQIN